MYNTFSFTFMLFSEPITFLLYSLSMQTLQKIGFKNVKVQHNVIMIASQRKRNFYAVESAVRWYPDRMSQVRIRVIIGVRVDVRVLTL